MAGAWRGISAGGIGDLQDLASDDGAHDFTRQRRGGSEPLSDACQCPAAPSGGRSRLNRRVLPGAGPPGVRSAGRVYKGVMDRRALVLGGGGVTGIAWEIGVIAGLADRGIDLAAADVVIGTSAGSVVGADITSGHEPEALYQAQLAPPDPEPAARIGWGPIGRLLWVMNTSRDPVRARARIGDWALAAHTMPEADRRKVFEARLPVSGWPAKMLKVTAVDARTGEFVVFDSSGEAALVDAVGASCAVPGVWPPVTIGNRRFVDGGVRSVANADLAARYQRVVIVAPVAQGIGPIMPGPGRQAAALAAAGARVALVRPDRSAMRAIGHNVLDVSRRAAAATAGRAQAAAEAAAVRTVWQAEGGPDAS
jgi:NTE family protein